MRLNAIQNEDFNIIKYAISKGQNFIEFVHRVVFSKIKYMKSSVSCAKVIALLI